MLPRIMVVEDDAVLREIYMLKFELSGYPACEAENGMDALSKLDSFNPDIILLDLMMPVMGGLDFLRYFQKRESAAVIIVFTNVSAPDLKKAVLSLGASDYLVKSDYTPDLVLQQVIRPIQSRKATSD